MSFGGASLGSAEGRITIDIAQAQGALTQLDASLNRADASGANFGVGMAKGASGAAQAFNMAGAAAGGFLVSAIKTAATFEFRLSAIQSVLGATDSEMKVVKQSILDIGAASVYTNDQVGRTAEELAKLGVTGEDITKGALQAVVDLAAATETAPDTAAAIVGAALNQYQLAGEDAVHVADLFTRAANQSAADVSELGDGFKYVAGQAHALGIPIEELVASLEILSDQGLKGSKAGTGLRQVLTSIVNPTKEATALMDQYGIAVKDASGEFVGVPKLLENIHTQLSGLSDFDRQGVLNSIFGDQGGTAINALLQSQEEEAKAAGKSWEDYVAGLESGSTANEQAAERMDNLRGSLEKLKGTLDTLRVKIGTPFLAGLKVFIDALTAMLDQLASLPDEVLKIITAIVAPFALFGTLKTIGMVAGNPLLRMIPGFTGLASAATALAGPLAIVVGLLALLAVAYKTNFGGLKDFAKGVEDKFKSIKNRYNELAHGFAGENARNAILGFDDTAPMDDFLGKLHAIGIAVEEFTGIDVKDWLQDFGKGLLRFPPAIEKIGDGLSDLSDEIKDKGLTKGIKAIFGSAGRKILAGFGDSLAAVPKLFGDMISGISTGNKTADRLLDQVGRSFTDFGRLVQEIGQGDVSGFVDVLGRLGERLVNLASDLTGLAFDGLLDLANIGIGAIGDIDWENVLSTIADTAPKVLDVAFDIVASIASVVWDGAKDLSSATLLWLTGGPTDPAGTGGPEQKSGTPLNVAFDVLATIARVVWGAAGDFVGAVMALLLGTSTKTSGDGTGGPESDTGSIGVLPAAFDVLATIAKLTWEGAKDFGAYAWEKAQAAGSVVIPAVFDIAATIGGILWNGAVSLVGAIQQGAEFVGDTVIPFVADIAATIGGILWNGVASLGGAISVAASFVGDTVVPAVVKVAAEIGGILWDGVASLGGAIAVAASFVGNTIVPATIDIAANIGGILYDGIVSAADAVRLKIGPVVVDAVKATITWALSWGGTVPADLSAWIHDTIGTVNSSVDAKLSINPQADVNEDATAAGEKAGRGIAENIRDGLTAGLESIFGGGGGGGEDGQGKGGTGLIGDVLSVAFLPIKIATLVNNFMVGVVDGIGRTMLSTFATNMKTLANPFISLPGIISGWFDDIFSETTFGANGSQDPAQGFSQGTDLLAGIKEFFDTTLIGELANIDVSGIAGALSGVKDAILTGIRDALPSGDALLDAIPTSLKEFFKDPVGWIHDHVVGGNGGSATTSDAAEWSASFDDQQLGGSMDKGWEHLKEVLKKIQNEPIPTGIEADPNDPNNNIGTSALQRTGLDTASIARTVDIAKTNAKTLATGVGDSTKAAQNIPAPPAALTAPSDLQDSFLKRVGLDATTVANTVSAAMSSAGTLAAGLAAAQAASRPKFDDSLAGGGGRAKLPEIDTSGAPTVVPAPDTSAFQAAIAALPPIVAAAIATMVVQFGTGGAIMVSQMTTAMSSVASVVAAVMGTIPGIIAGALAGAAATAFSMGANIGSSLAAGINSQVGAVAAAAANLASAAEAATAAKAKIASPSKVFIALGQFIGKGFALGMTNTVGLIHKSAALMATAAVPNDMAIANAAGANARAGQQISRAAQPAGSTTIRNYRVDAKIDPTQIKTVNDMVRYLGSFENSADITSRPGRTKKG